MMTLNEAKEVFINRAFIPTDDGSGRIHDPQKWREACYVISKWLEQEPCNDAISRQDILNILPAFRFNSINDYLDAKNKIEKLSPVHTEALYNGLDKIRAEVLEYIDDLDIATKICDIFDKYITESEG